MKRIILHRLLQGILVLLVLYTVSFFLVRGLPGSPFDAEKDVPAHVLERLEENYGLNDPWPVQYFGNLGRMFTGDFGKSTMLGDKPVARVLKHAFPVSLTIGLFAMAFALIMGIPAGVLAAARKNQLLDYTTMALAMLGICLPSFVIGPLLAEWLGARLKLFPPSGWNHALSFFLPALTLSLIIAAYISRLTRAGMLEVLTSDYIRTARSKGLSERRVLFVHALRGALIPVSAYLGPALATVVSGSIVVESVFSVPGMGKLFIDAIQSADSFMIHGCVLLYGALLVVGVLASDLLLLWINPQLRS